MGDASAAGKLPEYAYVKRGVAPAVAKARGPIVVLEGPPGSGKTALVRNEPALQGFRYITLADDEVRAQALAQPMEWLASLPRPIVIDDVHRADLLLAAAQHVVALERRNAEPGSAPRGRFLLVSSRMLPALEQRAEEDPLLPVPERFSLLPFTQAELWNREGCIIDDLFDRPVNPGFRTAFQRSDLRTMMRVGGFPAWALHSSRLNAQQRSQRVREGLRAVLEEDCGDPHIYIDQVIEHLILRKVLATPGLPLNVETVARACYVDPATLTNHLSMFADRFIIHYLHCLDKRHTIERAFGKTRIYPVDTTIIVEAMSAKGRDITVDSLAFGKAMKVLCLGQLLPAVQWASQPTKCCHWKQFDKKVRRVDIVLQRGNRLVGIMLRNALSLPLDSMNGMLKLACDKRFERGFVIYPGTITRQLAENIWALPVSALWEEKAFRRKKQPGQDEPAEAEAPRRKPSGPHWARVRADAGRTPQVLRACKRRKDGSPAR